MKRIAISSDVAVADRVLLENSGHFDAARYRRLAGLSEDDDPMAHYLSEGWRRGLETGRNFDGEFLGPYYESVGYSGPPILTWTELSACGRAPATRGEAEALAEQVRESGLFDADAYAKRLPSDLDPALHYVLVGEQAGWAPSDRLDPLFYRERYGDIVASGVSPLLHFHWQGRREGRRPVSFASQLVLDRSRLDPNRDTVLLVVHEASRTGAPILAYNIATRLGRRCNVVALLLQGGELRDDFQACCAAVVGPPSEPDWHPCETGRLVERLVATYRISYAIANSIASGAMLKPLTLAQIPVVALVHEFSSYVPPPGEMGRSLEWATRIVFSAKLTAAAACDDYPNLANRPVHILRQGRPDLPPRDTSELAAEQQSLRAALRPEGDADAFVVLGCGTVNIRKGVDIFLCCASAVAALRPRRRVRFVWIGSPTATDMDRIYESFLTEQVTRAGLKDMVTFVGEVADLDPAYESADLFFMSSRLDPLPNVAIEAALRGMPVICFENATGVGEILGDDPVTRAGVVPHLDAQAAARLIAELADDAAAYRKMSDATRRLAERDFDMDGYVRRLDGLGRDAMAQMRQRRADFTTIAGDSMFDMDMFENFDPAINTRADAIHYFLARSAAFGIGTTPSTNYYYRRPCPGFHPQIYEHENAGRYDRATVNPLAHFIRRGKPDGPWRHDVITPSSGSADAPPRRPPRVAIHGHFYYPELVSEFIRSLDRNRLRCDLLLSTSDEDKAAFLRRATSDYGRGTVSVRVAPNRGRDIGPMLTLFARDILGGYDLIGHIHGKRSLFIEDVSIGESWREFLWQNLIGGLHPMADTIIARFVADERLGIVFPDDPHLSDWDLNLEVATRLAAAMRMREPLPPFFDFPIGTMFWARPDALRPLFDLKLTWEDYPAEPLPIDGTVLHGIERLLPFVARHAGYKYATTHVPGVTW